MSELDINAIRERLKGQNGKQYWRSLDELAETEEFQSFLHEEFPRQAAPLEGTWKRRDFMKLLGASLALRSEEHTSELQSRGHLVCRLLLEKKKTKKSKY